MIHQVIFMYINNKIYHMSLLACMLSVLLISIFLPYTQNSAPRPQKADSVYSFISPQEEEQTTILIDAGHGGYDGGSTSWDERVNEKDVTLQIALKTGALLEDLGYRIVYSRTDDNVSWPQDNAADLQARVDLGLISRRLLLIGRRQNHVIPLNKVFLCERLFILLPGILIALSQKQILNFLRFHNFSLVCVFMKCYNVAKYVNVM